MYFKHILVLNNSLIQYYKYLLKSLQNKNK